MESPQEDPDPGNALRAHHAPVADCRGRGRHSHSLACCQPCWCRTESESPPPSLHPQTNHRHATHCGSRGRDLPPKPSLRPSFPQSPRLLLAWGSASIPSSRSPEPWPLEPGQGNEVAAQLKGGCRPTAVFICIRNVAQGRGETEMVK